MLSDHAILLPIDVQRAFDDPSWGRRNNPAMEAQGLRLLAAWRGAGRPVIHVKHNSALPNSTLRPGQPGNARSEEHTSELQSLMRISYAVFCLKKKTKTKENINQTANNTK